MRLRPLIVVLLGLLVLAGVWFFLPSGPRPGAQKNQPAAQSATPGAASSRPASTAPVLFVRKTATNAPAAAASTNQFAWRLNNTSKTIGQLMNDPHAILLANAFIDAGSPLTFSIPKNLQSAGDPGAYIVQARGPLDIAFRAILAAAGAQIVSYIPNNAYLVRISSGGAAGLAGQPPVQSVIPYEPYYKISSALIGAAVQQQDLPGNSGLTLGLFADTADATIDQIQNLGGSVVATDRSPFGPIVRVLPPANWTALATLPGVQIVELTHQRRPANDLARVTMGISADTVTPTNYMGLYGNNVLVEMNDTGVWADHPDFSLTGTAESPSSAPPSRVIGALNSLIDVNGHGTHVAGIIAGNGSESYSLIPTNEPQGSVTNADFRGKAPLAQVYSFAALDTAGNLNISDYEMQEVPATNNALISNNSWNYDDATYDLAAASYDAAVRDALPLATGSQPVLFVFSAGNDGGAGDDSGLGGIPDTILSPATAKDVITVGALEQLRYITNSVTNMDGSVTTPFQDGTDSANEVASYSARGNVGILTEGPYGRFKPDVVAPGSFVVSTRPPETGPSMWDQVAYYNPTNYTFNDIQDQVVQPGTLLQDYSIFVPQNAAGLIITVLANSSSPLPFPTNLPIYVMQGKFPTSTSYDFMTANNQVNIPPDGGGGYLDTIQNGWLNFGVGNSTNIAVNYDVITEIITTNDLGNYFQVLSNMNETLAPFYRYESGTSMAAPAVSGTLALIQDYYTNILKSTTAPSPALLKAMVINGARSQGTYSFAVTNLINLQGWGLPIVTNSLPYGVTNQYNAYCASFFLDQSPTNALATGDGQTFMVNLETNINGFATLVQPLRVTLAWTDPPGNPAAALKLVNSLELVVTNLDDGTVYYGNDLDDGTPSYSAPWVTNTTPNIDMVNNVQNVFLQPLLGTSYSVTVIGRSVNVNAVTAQSNNVVQDFALVISSGDGEITNAISVSSPTVNTFIGPQVTYIATTNTLLMNQIAGGNTPLLGTNLVDAGPGYASNAVITVGITNQWHFYVVTNTLGFTNAAFITFLSQTLATPRMGVFADPTQNPTQPEADIDLYVANAQTDPGAAGLLNLDPNVISNCVNGINGDAASLGNGTGTEFVAYSNSAPGQVYYIGVKSETQEGAIYDFLPVFSELPFSETDSNGNETVYGLLVPVNIPDGSPAHPGTAYVIALAVQPVTVENVTVTNTFISQNFGDLVGILQHSGASVVLNNHNSPLPTIQPDIFDFIYDQSPAPVIGSQPPDGPGSLKSFEGQQGAGPWILTESDNSLTQTSSVTSLTIYIKPHVTLTGLGAIIALPPQSYFYGFVDVPAGATNLTIAATNITTVPDPAYPGELFEELGLQPTLTNYDKTATLNNGFPPGAVITVGPSDLPPIQPGRYYVTLYNPSFSPQTYYVLATISLGQAAPVDFGSSGPTNLLDDAVMYSSVFVTNTLPIATVGVGLRVDHPRISDLVFHLISPDGTRYLLMENRGGESTNGCGVTLYTTNVVNVASSGGSTANTNYVQVFQNTGTLTVNYNFYQAPDQMTVYASTNPADFFLASPTLILNTGFIPNGGQLNIPFTTTSGYLTIIMNEFGNPDTNTLWTYTAGGVQTNYYYLVLTEDTNLTTTPIKFAPPPFVPAGFYSTNFGLGNFESAAPGDYAPSSTVNGWGVISNQVSVVNDPVNAYQGSQFLALANGVISNNIPTIPGGKYTMTYAYRGPGAVSWWRGEDNTLDSVSGNNGSLVGGAGYTTGEVGLAFVMDGNQQLVTVGNPTNLQLQNFTIEGWIRRTSALFTTYGSYGNGCIFAYGLGGYGVYLDANGTPALTQIGISQTKPSISLTDTSWHHLAVTKSGGTVVFYVDGVAYGAPAYNPTFTFTTAAAVGGRGDNLDNSFLGAIDEESIYQRILSPSEIKAIYTDGSAGKFNPAFFTTSPASSLAEANVKIPGVSDYSFYGDNTNWQQQTISFTATSTLTPVVITGLEPGMLLDNFNVSGAGGGGNLYYLPEQDLSPLNGTSAYGLWQLEIQDDRVGATNHTVLDSWQLQFVFANTNPVPLPETPITLSPGTNICNPVPATNILWYQVSVPPNAIFATNILTSSDQPVNLLFNQNSPDTTGAYVLLTNQTSGISILSTTNGTPLLVPGLTYYLGVQNPNNVPVVDACIEVDFDLLATAFAFTEPAQLVTGTSAQLNGMATPNGYPATAWFQWGTNTSYGNQTPQIGVGNGYNVVYTTSPILNLVTNMPYHFRLVVSNSLGVVYGFDQIFDEAYVAAWGANYVGQANVPSSLSNNVVAIAGADDHSLALKQDGTALGWGDNTFGQATVPAGLSNLVAVAGGAYYSMALVNSGTVASWGANVLGQTNVPVGLINVITIAGGTYASLALRSDGSVAAWGASFFNLTNVPVGLSNVVAVAGGSYHNLALKNDGTVTAWGDDSAGQTNVPPDLTNVVGIAAGNYHSLALKYDGTVVSWGDDSAFQTNVPVSLSNVVAVAAGGFSSMALLADGTVVTWGDNTAGQSSVPVGLTNVVAISSGYLHSLALSPQPLASLTNVVLNLTNGVPQTNTIAPFGVTYYQISVPTNADFATNLLLFTINGPLSVWFTTNSPPTIGHTNDALLLSDVTNGVSLLSTTSSPLLVPGSIYYLGVENQNSVAVNYGIEVDFHLVTTTNTPPSTNAIPISGIIYTNIGGTNGFWLTWFAPSNDLFQVQWTTSLVPATWTTFTNPPVVSYNPNFPAGPTNAQFNFFDDGSQTGGFGPTRFYRIILLGSAPSTNTPPVLPPQAAQIVNPLNPLVVINTATDAQSPPQVLTYTLTSTVTGTNPPVISANGIITWTPEVSQAGTSNLFTTVVTDNGVPPLSATNSFAVIVNPVPGISSITYSNGGYLLTWWAPTNDIFAVQVATNLASPTLWLTIATNITYTGPLTPTNGLFSYFDDGSQVPFGALRFYQLVLVGVALPANTPPQLPSQIAQIVNPLNPLVVVNTATDAESPPQILTYTLTSTVTGTNPPVISTNGIITWTPDVSQAGTSNLITTIVTDDGVPPLSATNSFAVIVNPVPGISSVTYSNGGYLLTWWAPTNDIFAVQVATNLASPTVWLTIATNVTYTGPVTPTNGLFSYYDDGSQVPLGSLRFYRLQLVGILPPATTTVPIGGITSTNGGFLLTWFAATNDQFNVRWATNLVPPINWTTFPDLITSTNGVFTFMDTNAPLLLKFYELILLP